MCASLFLLSRAAPAQVTTSQYDNARTGANTHETILTPRNVNAREFGRRFRIAVDGDVFAQPLYVPRVSLASGVVRNLLFVATEHGSVYAWDADSATARPAWHVSFIRPEAGVTPVPSRDVHCPFIKPDVGITCTPVIDLPARTLFVLARTREQSGAGVHYAERLHALDLSSGAERPGSPVEVRAAAPGKGDGASSNGVVVFDGLHENPRASLVVVAGKIVLTWASSCDVGPYHGWVITYDARTLRQLGTCNTTPDAAEGGIWQSDTGPAANASGTFYVITGNGGFDAASGGRDYGNSVLAFAPDGPLRPASYFTPHDQARLDAEDGDLGSGGPVLAGGDASGPQRLIFGSKAGTLYVLDPENLGGYHAGGDSGAVQVLPNNSNGEYGAPAYWNGHVFVQGSDEPLRDYALAGGRMAAKPVESVAKMPNPGATPTISANDRRDGIVWMVQSKPFASEDRPAILRAYDAANVAHELYTSEMVPTRDRAGIALRFNIPTVANGRVYVGTRGGVDVYGLQPQP